MKLKVLWVGYVSKNHSWSFVAQNICRSLIKRGYQVDIFSTNGIDFFPEDLKPNLIGYLTDQKTTVGKPPTQLYDVNLTYTAMKNFPAFLQHSSKNRFGIYTYEFAGKNSLPNGFAKQHIYCNYLLAPSKFAKEVFLNNGIPDQKIPIIPHGVNYQEIATAIPFELKTSKKTKILINLGQLHKRKDLTTALEIFGKSFNKNNDVCLVLKIAEKYPRFQFEQSFSTLLTDFKKKFPNHAEIEIIKQFIPNIYSLYKSCDINFTATNCEGFGMPQLESLACGLVNVASNYGGYLDFLSDKNSLLIDGKQFIVSPDYLYYSSKLGLKAFKCNIQDGINKLQEAVSNVDEWKKKCREQQDFIQKTYSWDQIGEQVLNLVV